MANIKDFFTVEKFDEFYCEFASEKSNYLCVLDALKKKKISDREKARVAEEILQQVALYEYAKDMALNGESEKMFADFMKNTETLEPEARTELLQELDFGLGVYQNPDAVQRLNRNETLKKLFEEYKNSENNIKTNEELEADIYAKLSGYRISPVNMKRFIDGLEENAAYVSCAAIGRSAERFKAELAAKIYASEDISVEEAVQKACYMTDVESLADAVGEGIVSAEKAKKIIGAITLALFFVLIVVAAYLMIEGQILYALAMLVGFGTILEEIDNRLGEYIGELAARYTFVKYLKQTKISEGVQALENAAENDDCEASPTDSVADKDESYEYSAVVEADNKLPAF